MNGVPRQVPECWWYAIMAVQASTLSSVHCKVGNESTAHEDFFTKQARLQAEAKLALAQVIDLVLANHRPTS